MAASEQKQFPANDCDFGGAMTTSTTTIDSQRGAISRRRDRIFLSAVDTYENVDLNRGSFNDTSDRIRVSAAQVLQGRPAVILIFGQSNGANSGKHQRKVGTAFTAPANT